MFALSAALLLCSLAMSQSAPLPCDDLIRPSDRVDVHHLLGKWVMIAGSLSNGTFEERFKQRDTATIVFANDTTGFSIHRHFGFGDICRTISSNVTLNGSSITFDNFNSTITFLRSSCTDCLVAHFDVRSNNIQRMFLFSRGREVKPEEVEEFTAQSDCLDLFPPVMMDPTKELCPLSEWTEGKMEPRTEESSHSKGGLEH